MVVVGGHGPGGGGGGGGDAARPRWGVRERDVPLFVEEECVRACVRACVGMCVRVSRARA